MGAAWIIAVALAARSGAAPPAEQGWAWQETATPHFLIRHQATWLPSHLTMDLEKIYFRLHMDLGRFSSWTEKNAVNVYLYQDMKSYVGGEFSPPPWSDGVAIYDKNAVAIPGMRPGPQMLQVLAHENTHLIFVRYFRESRRDPPSWINEGLAMLEESDSPEKPEASRWYQSMVATDSRRWFPLDRFFAISPMKDLHDDKEQVATFYVQAYSIVHFLVRKHSRFQFKSFCDRLREGKSAAEALRLAYHYRDIGAFERNWRAWLGDPSHKRRVDELPLAQRVQDDGVVDQVDSAFPGFSTGWKTKSASAIKPTPMTASPAASADR